MMADPDKTRAQAGGQRWTREYLERRGTDGQAFRDRRARARPLHLRRRELLWNWLALALVAGCWDVAGRLDEVEFGARHVAVIATMARIVEH